MPLVLSGFAGGGAAETTQIECSKLDEGMRTRCEQVNHMNEVCANMTDEQRKTCERTNLYVSSFEDCSRAPEPARVLCEQRNRAVAATEQCRALTGPAREACARQNVTKSGARQL